MGHCLADAPVLPCHDEWGGIAPSGRFAEDFDERRVADVLGNVAELVVVSEGRYGAAGRSFRSTFAGGTDPLLVATVANDEATVDYGVRCIIDDIPQ